MTLFLLFFLYIFTKRKFKIKYTKKNKKIYILLMPKNIITKVIIKILLKKVGILLVKNLYIFKISTSKYSSKSLCKYLIKKSLFCFKIFFNNSTRI